MDFGLGFWLCSAFLWCGVGLLCLGWLVLGWDVLDWGGVVLIERS